MEGAKKVISLIASTGLMVIILSSLISTVSAAEPGAPPPTAPSDSSMSASSCRAKDGALPYTSSKGGILLSIRIQNAGKEVEIMASKDNGSPNVMENFTYLKTITQTLSSYTRDLVIYKNSNDKTVTESGTTYTPLLQIELYSNTLRFIMNESRAGDTMFFLNKPQADLTDYEMLINSVYPKVQLNCNVFAGDISDATFIAPNDSTPPKIQIPANPAESRPEVIFKLTHVISKGGLSDGNKLFYFTYESSTPANDVYKGWGIRVHATDAVAYATTVGNIKDYQDDSASRPSSVGGVLPYVSVKFGADNKQPVLDNLLNWVYNDKTTPTGTAGTGAEAKYPDKCRKFTGPDPAQQKATYTTTDLAIDGGCLNLNGVSGDSIDTAFAGLTPIGWLKKWSVSANGASATNSDGSNSTNDPSGCSALQQGTFDIVGAIKVALCSMIYMFHTWVQSLYGTAMETLEKVINIR